MTSKDKPQKKQLHPRNQHQGRYNFDNLIIKNPDLESYLQPNPHGDQTIDFSNPEAVKALNSALLKTHYNLEFWDIPEGFLCPPIPGRADYIHYVADLLNENSSKNPTGKKITILDIGTGANCIYPIIGNYEYNWSFIASDISKKAIASAEEITSNNKKLSSSVNLRLQQNKRFVFEGIIEFGERIDAVICNPPFHSSLKEAQKANNRKTKNLKLKSNLNFGGHNNELWCQGGELKFIRDMIFESRRFQNKCFWFSTLVSKKENLKSIYRTLNKVEAIEIKTIEMGQGNKSSRIVCWTFLDKEKQQNWIDKKW